MSCQPVTTTVPVYGHVEMQCTTGDTAFHCVTWRKHATMKSKIISLIQLPSGENNEKGLYYTLFSLTRYTTHFLVYCNVIIQDSDLAFQVILAHSVT